MPGFTTDAILLRKIEYGDHDFIISFLTESKGKISVIAKNAKKLLDLCYAPNIVDKMLTIYERIFS